MKRLASVLLVFVFCFSTFAEDKPTIELFIDQGTWYAICDEFKDLFGTDILPTPFTSKIPAEIVQEEIQKKNPWHTVTILDSSSFYKIGNFTIKQWVRNEKNKQWQKKREELERKKTCNLIKDRVKKNIIDKEHMQKILEKINEKGKRFPKQKDRSVTEEVGTKLLKGKFTVSDFEVIQEVIKNKNYEEYKPDWKDKAAKVVGSWILYLWNCFGEYGEIQLRTPTIIPGGIVPAL